MSMTQAANTPEEEATPVAIPISVRVVNAMNKLGVAGLPRNYELFYFAMTETKPELKEELWTLGTGMNQQQLDTLHSKHCAAADDEKVVARICSAVEKRVSETMDLIREESKSVSNYSRVLTQASQRMDEAKHIPPGTIRKMVSVISEATHSTQDHNQRTLRGMKSNSTELGAIQDELEEYKRLAETDPLTGLLNRRGFDKRLAELGDHLKQTALVIGDIDSFKALNDTYGHPFGDTVIRTVAKIFRANTREDTIVARIGGEEFAILATNTDPESIRMITERVRIAVERTPIVKGQVKLAAGTVTVSFGLCHGAVAHSADSLYDLADQALYHSKKTGRNRVSTHADLPRPPNRKNLSLYKD